jgi:hypothetical protein
MLYIDSIVEGAVISVLMDRDKITQEIWEKNESQSG